MKAASALRKIMDRILGSICVLLFALMTIIGTYQIVVRYFFNRPSTISEELLTYSFTWLALLAAAYVFGKREHMRMSFLVDKLSEGKQRGLNILIELLILLFAAIVLVHGGISIINLTMTQLTASLGVSMGVIYMVVPISGILTMIYSLLNIIELCRRDERPRLERVSE